jgi:hypothetical protein
MATRFVFSGAALLAASAALCNRAGYGPCADKANRGNGFMADRCVHNVSLLALTGAATLIRGRRIARRMNDDCNDHT